MPDFVERIAQQIALNPTEIAILRQTGVRSFEDVESLVSNFPSLQAVGVRLPFLSNAVRSSLSGHFLAAANSLSIPHTRPTLRRGGRHPPGARWAAGAAVPLPAPASAAAPAPVATPAAIDLRVAPWPVRDQGQRGTCVAFSTTACAELRNFAGGPNGPPDYSEQFLYWDIKTNTGDPQPNQDGTYLQFSRDALSNDGICAESMWPYVGTPIPGNISQGGGGNPSAATIAAAKASRITATAYQVFNTPGGGAAAVLNLLQTNRRPVAIIVPVFSDPAVPNNDNWSTASAWAYGRILNPPATSHVSDGHSVCVVGFEPDSTEANGGYFIFRNSWDVSWAYAAPAPGNSYSPERGYGDISATYIEDYMWELLQI